MKASPKDQPVFNNYLWGANTICCIIIYGQVFGVKIIVSEAMEREREAMRFIKWWNIYILESHAYLFLSHNSLSLLYLFVKVGIYILLFMGRKDYMLYNNIIPNCTKGIAIYSFIVFTGYIIL